MLCADRLFLFFPHLFFSFSFFFLLKQKTEKEKNSEQPKIKLSVSCDFSRLYISCVHSFPQSWVCCDELL